MGDDEPITDACKMPTFTGSFEEARVKPSHRPMETSPTDGKVERPVRDSSRRVSSSHSGVSLHGDEGHTEEKEEEDAKGNNNNNCNGGGGGGGERRRASAVEILRRNFGVSKSPSLRLGTSTRMQRSTEREASEGTVDTDVSNGYGSEINGCGNSELETGDAVTENEPTLSDFTTLDVQGVEFVSVTGQCRYKGESDTKTDTLDEFLNEEEHVYCTVYCIANDIHRRDVEITDDDTVTSDAAETDSETGPGTGENPGPVLYTMEDLVDRYGVDLPRLSSVLVSADEPSMRTCGVCMEVKTIAPMPCCRMPVCDECLRIYVSNMVGLGEGQGG